MDHYEIFYKYDYHHKSLYTADDTTMANDSNNFYIRFDSYEFSLEQRFPTGLASATFLSCH